MTFPPDVIDLMTCDAPRPPAPAQAPLKDGGEVYRHCLLSFGAILFGVYTLQRPEQKGAGLGESR